MKRLLKAKENQFEESINKKLKLETELKKIQSDQEDLLFEIKYLKNKTGDPIRLILNEFILGDVIDGIISYLPNFCLECKNRHYTTGCIRCDEMCSYKFLGEVIYKYRSSVPLRSINLIDEEVLGLYKNYDFSCDLDENYLLKDVEIISNWGRIYVKKFTIIEKLQ